MPVWRKLRRPVLFLPHAPQKRAAFRRGGCEATPKARASAREGAEENGRRRNCQPLDPPRRRMRPIQRIFAHAVSSSFQMRVRFRRAKILNRPRLGLNAFCGKSVTGGDAPQENQVQRGHAGRVTLPQTCRRRIAYRAGASVPLTRQTAGAVPQHVSKPRCGRFRFLARRQLKRNESPTLHVGEKSYNRPRIL